MRYFVELAYNGKNFHGWQKQPQAITVQSEIEKALSLLLKENIEVMGCGRTDTGVHASQFFLHFDTDKKLNPEQMVFKLNAFLGKDVVIYRLFKVPELAHARFSALSRTYIYKIHLGKTPFFNALEYELINTDLNVDLMNEAASLLIQFNDFKCFSRSNTDVKTYLCRIDEAYWQQDQNHLYFRIKADRFLRNMVRAIVGTLLDVGREKTTIDQFKKIIESRDRTKAGASAKAKGLYLCEISYPKEILK